MCGDTSETGDTGDTGDEGVTHNIHKPSKAQHEAKGEDMCTW